MPWLIELLDRFDLRVLGTNRRIPAILSAPLYTLDKGIEAGILIGSSLASPMEMTRANLQCAFQCALNFERVRLFYVPWEGTTDLRQQIRIMKGLSPERVCASGSGSAISTFQTPQHHLSRTTFKNIYIRCTRVITSHPSRLAV